MISFVLQLVTISWDDMNKKELNEFIAETLVTMTCQEEVLSNCEETFPDSDHEEADRRVVLHTCHALSQNKS